MRHIVISDTPFLLSNWKSAFDSEIRLHPPTSPETVDAGTLYWLDWHSLPEPQAESLLRALLKRAAKVVVMSARPGAEQGMSFVVQGARGYCHRHAAANQLQEIALVIKHGGLWLGADAMSRLLRGTLQVLAPVNGREYHNAALDALTDKEKTVAQAVARGASNREIAEALTISERTVKAHLSSIFSKYHVRDRVQLALKLNNVPVG